MVPPGPVQLRVYVVVIVRLPVDCEPPVATGLPFKVQEAALVDVQRRVVEAPQGRFVVSAESVAVGAGAITSTVHDADLPTLVTVTVLVPAVV